MKRLRPLFLAASVAWLGACGLLYKVDVNQGNLLDAKDVEALKPGMTQRQVELLLGSPSVSSPFHHDRWDYAATFSRRGRAPEVKNLTLFFENGLLSRIEGDYFTKREKEILDDASRLRGRPVDPFEESEEEKGKRR